MGNQLGDAIGRANAAIIARISGASVEPSTPETEAILQQLQSGFTSPDGAECLARAARIELSPAPPRNAPKLRLVWDAPLRG